MDNNTTTPAAATETPPDAATNNPQEATAPPPLPAVVFAQPAHMPAHELENIELQEFNRRLDRITGNMVALRAIPYAPAAVARGDVDYRPGRPHIQAYGPFYQYLEAFMIQARFAPRVGAARCAQCQANLGPFETCVASPDFLRGSCACCHWSRQTRRCSFRSEAAFTARVLLTISVECFGG
jgi:hypothetical protein